MTPAPMDEAREPTHYEILLSKRWIWWFFVLSLACIVTEVIEYALDTPVPGWRGAVLFAVTLQFGKWLGQIERGKR